MERDRDGARMELSAGAPRSQPGSSARAHLEMLRRVTRDMVAAHELPTLLGSIASALVEHTGAAIARIALYQTDDECDICRASSVTGVADPGVRRLHHAATAGIPFDIAGPAHLVLNSSVAWKVVRERQPWLCNDLSREQPEFLSAERQLMIDNGLVAVGAYPLEFRGELLGVIGILGFQPFDPRAFNLLQIFTAQAAMAIKSAGLFRELALYQRRLQIENAYLQEEIRAERGFEGIVGESAVLKDVARQVMQVAGVETTVLLTGETGTGKELIARAIHSLSPRKERALIKVNCGAIPQGLVESELFGHEKGAFTGALQRRIGRFELADKGTLFMDEAGELPLETQIKLLRVLQEQEFERVGGSRAMKVDVRLVAATNRELEQEVAAGRFRSDLFFRLNVFPIRIPPLRERPGDIPLLVRHFLGQFERKLAKPLRAMAPGSLDRLQRYSWPGNVRELQNVLERACVLASSPIVEVAGALDMSSGSSAGELEKTEPIMTLDDGERQLVGRALAATNGKIHGPNGAAALLGLNGNTLRSRMQKLGIGNHGS